MLTFIKKLFSIVLLIVIIAAVGYIIYYPNKDKVKIFFNEINPYNIAHNTSLAFLIDASRQQNKEDYFKASETKSIEEVTPSTLALYQNGGNTIYELEKFNTYLEIPSADIAGKVFDGESSWTMVKGFWHFPLSSMPGIAGNTVIIGHRYDKMPPATDTFFNLDKVKIGDKVYITQNDEKLSFTVTETKIVEKTNREILTQTDDYRITIITCHPLWTDDQRFVVIAKLDKIYRNI